MGRPEGVPNQGNLIGEPEYGLDHLWRVMVRPRSPSNLRRWISYAEFATEHGAETHWSQYKADTAGMERNASKLFFERFIRIADHVPVIAPGLLASEGVTFRVKPVGDKWRVEINTPAGVWHSQQQWGDRETAVLNRINLRFSSRNLKGQAWTGWLLRKFVKEVEDGTVEE